VRPLKEWGKTALQEKVAVFGSISLPGLGFALFSFIKGSHPPEHAALSRGNGAAYMGCGAGLIIFN
jgi:hypothetical protein